jgi:hypothetical protein
MKRRAMSNQRKESRKKLVAFTPVYDLLHKILIGYVGDLTPQGVMVISEKSFEINKHLTLGIEFPDEVTEAHVLRVVISARAAWCKLDEDTKQFTIGFEFHEVTPETAKVIEKVVERYQFHQVGSEN